MTDIHSTPEDFNALAAMNIRMQIAKQRLTLATLSEATGISRAQLSRLANGERDITLTQLHKIAAAMRVDITKLISE